MENAIDKDLVVVGHLMRTHGFKGEIKCAPQTHDIKRCQKLTTVYALCSKDTLPLKVENARIAGDLWILKFQGYDSPASLKSLVNADICVPMSERIPAPEGKYYFSDLEGYSVIGDADQEIAKVLSVEVLPSVNAFRFTYKGSEILAPWIKECVGEINSEKRTVKISEVFLQKLFEMRVE
ncbi:MAG: ribosome maturation factor RimM [Hallerella porci]|uniref:Ribosome maturation factor RimM n=1 Tax=Hallerella porci TaxID=1945871 RepID=A0ABX5LN81_9BACT|nr:MULTISPECIES: ribosome maturation factor RimM [Hallerella]MCI5600671.1 ribosome maturation factor RimM [Hallerella sp.]MDY3921636.1 ribosome maturation factor RimM [Hallerella porci]PWK94152.1 16S rRNA processing protein RimM [Hallerella porci]